MIIKSPHINQYLVSICLLIIDMQNDKYHGISKNDLKIIADDKFSEMDLSAKLGYPFGQMVHYTHGDKIVNGNEVTTKINHDLYVEEKDFKIEVKYLKNWTSGNGITKSNSKLWKEFQKDFDWLFSEISLGNKFKRAMVIGWFNSVDSFAQYVQIGAGRGSKPLVNNERVQYFPFLKKLKDPTRTCDLAYDYQSGYVEQRLNLIGRDVNCNCMFIGNESDCFHFAIYY